MAATTTRQLAQDILKQINGGRRNVPEQGFSEEYVMQMIMQSRDLVTMNELSKHEDSEIPDPKFYTPYDGENAIPMPWDDNEDIAYAMLPNGSPVHIRWDRGLVVRQSRGFGAFYVRGPRGWCAANPDYAFCEGKYVWELRPNGKIVFPNIPRLDMPSTVHIEVIESGISDPDSPLRMPDRYVFTVRDMVLKSLGYGTRDLETNWKEDAK